jgi:hypothetical protein
MAWNFEMTMTNYTATLESFIGLNETDLVIAAQKLAIPDRYQRLL